jgi:hypothetical protein
MPDEGPLVPPRPGPHDPGMEARVTALESAIGEVLAELRAKRQDITGLIQDVTGLKQDVTGLKQDVTGLKQDVTDLKSTTRKMELDLARMDGRVSQMPTLLQLITVVLAIWGMAFATLRFAGVH